MCGKIETEDEKLERQLRVVVAKKENQIIDLQGEVAYFKEWITKLVQKNCVHNPQVGDDGGNLYCAKCGKTLS